MTAVAVTDIPTFTIRGPLLLLLADMDCWKCSSPFRVAAFAGTAETEAWLEDLEPPTWILFGDPEVLVQVSAMSEEVAKQVRNLAPTLALTFSQTAESRYWMNRCPACGTVTGDFYSQGADGPFFAWPRAGREGIQIVELGCGEIASQPPNIVPPEPPRRRRAKTPAI